MTLKQQLFNFLLPNSPSHLLVKEHYFEFVLPGRFAGDDDPGLEVGLCDGDAVEVSALSLHGTLSNSQLVRLRE